MRMKRIVRAALLLLLCLALSGCRTRTGTGGEADPERSVTLSGTLPGGSPEPDTGADEQEKNGEPGGQTRENPEASRKEYDETRPAEIVPGTDRTVHGSGEGAGLSAPGEDTDPQAAKLSEDAGKTASQTVAAKEAEQKGVSEEAEEADSAATYYTVLLQDRTGSLFECQRLYVYWETKEDHVTVYKTSPEHRLILDAGAYDVSARLLEGNLRVDDGWIGRKDPDIVVKVTDRSALGTGVFSADAAQRLHAGLIARGGWSAINAVQNGRVLLLSEEFLEAPHLRLAAELIIAKTANPELMADVDIERALAQLGEEATGVVPEGTYYYSGRGGL